MRISRTVQNFVQTGMEMMGCDWITGTAWDESQLASTLRVSNCHHLLQPSWAGRDKRNIGLQR